MTGGQAGSDPGPTVDVGQSGPSLSQSATPGRSRESATPGAGRRYLVQAFRMRGKLGKPPARAFAEVLSAAETQRRGRALDEVSRRGAALSGQTSERSQPQAKSTARLSDKSKAKTIRSSISTTGHLQERTDQAGAILPSSRSWSGRFAMQGMRFRSSPTPMGILATAVVIPARWPRPGQSAARSGRAAIGAQRRGAGGCARAGRWC